MPQKKGLLVLPTLATTEAADCEGFIRNATHRDVRYVRTYPNGMIVLVVLLHARPINRRLTSIRPHLLLFGRYSCWAPQGLLVHRRFTPRLAGHSNMAKNKKQRVPQRTYPSRRNPPYVHRRPEPSRRLASSSPACLMHAHTAEQA